ncbi:MAG TPA: sigma-70 family RNA polymerase sigma factor [Vicinamibacterales bacterium]|nr:sigma-70 family RNA polymerase sigma factor [Vicinamibacterales bacterium]
MTTTDPSATFEPHRRRLLGLAYRMLGSIAEAEDAVQETYLRWHETDRGRIADARAFLATTTTRICLDVLKSSRVKREQYVGPWLPDPITDTASLAPDAQTELAEDLSVALLLALDRLTPLERAAFLLHDVFDYPFSDVANALGRNEAACRQLASRARARMREARPQGAAPLRPGSSAAVDLAPKHAALMSAFMSASQSGDVEGLTRLLASDARFVSDGGGKVPAALNVVQGANRVAALVAGLVRKGWNQDWTIRFETINGLPGVIISAPGRLVQTTAFELEGEVVKAIYVVRNPDKLKHLAS